MTGAAELDDRDDRALLAAHVAGDPTAFGQLFARHRDRLYAVALRTAGDPDLAADALQEGLIAAFRRAGTFRGDSAVTSWLHRIVVNATLDLHRRNAVRSAEPLPEHGLDSRGGMRDATRDRERSETADPLDVVLADERRAQVLTALREIPADQRAALVLVDMEGWSVNEAASVLGCRPGTVKSRCSRGRRRLAQLLAEAPRPPAHDDGNHDVVSSVPHSDMSTRDPGEDGSP
ncbi:RNA polymerase sigma factor SigM [Nocardioidaceae bacterium]|nr:RNA polymerase sigma factor SigM [Nocardioidaceae bacterium]